MTKLAKHWNKRDDRRRSCSPLWANRGMSHESGPNMNANQILGHSREKWMNTHKLLSFNIRMDIFLFQMLAIKSLDAQRVS